MCISGCRRSQHQSCLKERPRAGFGGKGSGRFIVWKHGPSTLQPDKCVRPGVKAFVPATRSVGSTTMQAPPGRCFPILLVYAAQNKGRAAFLLCLERLKPSWDRGLVSHPGLGVPVPALASRYWVILPCALTSASPLLAGAHAWPTCQILLVRGVRASVRFAGEVSSGQWFGKAGVRAARIDQCSSVAYGEQSYLGQCWFGAGHRVWRSGPGLALQSRTRAPASQLCKWRWSVFPLGAVTWRCPQVL